MRKRDVNRDYLARLREKYGVVLDASAKELLGTNRVADAAAAP